MSDEALPLLQGEKKAAVKAALPSYLRGRRWFGGKARAITGVDLVEAMPLSGGTVIALVQVNYDDGGSQKYVLPMAFADGASAERVHGATIADLGSVVAYDATIDPDFTLGLLNAIKEEVTIASNAGDIVAWRTQTFDTLYARAHGELSPAVMGVEQSNSSIKYGDTLILKLFRRLEEGTSPELEFGRFLSEKSFAHTPPLAGAIEFRREGQEPLTLAILQGFARNEGDAWSYTLRTLQGYFARAMSTDEDVATFLPAEQSLLDRAGVQMPAHFEALAGDYLTSARLLARRTAELHLALGGGAGHAGFEPVSYTRDYQQSIYEAMRGLTGQAFGLLRNKARDLPGVARTEAERLLAQQGQVEARFEPFRGRGISALRTRVHGDYHLGQVLYTGSDFVIIDFEGEPVRSLAERRTMHSPLKDVAGMLRSFHYAAFTGAQEYAAAHGPATGAQAARLEAWANVWQAWVSVAFFGSYLETTRGSAILPERRDDLQTVLDAHLLEKAVYELVYELNNRPDWVRIPLSGIAQLL